MPPRNGPNERSQATYTWEREKVERAEPLASMRTVAPRGRPMMGDESYVSEPSTSVGRSRERDVSVSLSNAAINPEAEVRVSYILEEKFFI